MPSENFLDETKGWADEQVWEVMSIGFGDVKVAMQAIAFLTIQVATVTSVQGEDPMQRADKLISASRDLVRMLSGIDETDNVTSLDRARALAQVLAKA